MSTKQTPKEWVEAKIKEKKVVVFSKSRCPYCTRAKVALRRLTGTGGALSKDDIEIIEIEKRPDCNAIQNVLRMKTGGRTVPRVFINQKFFGGGDDTVKASENGSLAKLVREG